MSAWPRSLCSSQSVAKADVGKCVAEKEKRAVLPGVGGRSTEVCGVIKTPFQTGHCNSMKQQVLTDSESEHH